MLADGLAIFLNLPNYSFYFGNSASTFSAKFFPKVIHSSSSLSSGIYLNFKPSSITLILAFVKYSARMFGDSPLQP
jgi:hypothetical protein